MTWNQDRESIIAAAELGDAPAKTAVALLVDARKRAFDAEHKAQQLQAKLDGLKAAHVWIKPSDRLPAKNQTVVAMFRTRNKPSPKILLFAPMFKDYPYVWHSLETHDRFNSTYIIGWAPIPSENE